jgi:hypothetical protein
MKVRCLRPRSERRVWYLILYLEIGAMNQRQYSDSEKLHLIQYLGTGVMFRNQCLANQQKHYSLPHLARWMAQEY